MNSPEGVDRRIAPTEHDTLDAWLDWASAVHPDEIDLGLDRVRRVAVRLGLLDPPLLVVIVGGTNGKGSTVRMLETIWTAAGHRVGASTSPHVSRFNERVRVSGEEAGDADIARAFARVESARHAGSDHDDDETLSLTYFEFATLAAMVHFVDSGCAVAIMEVGLGGRLDAVNLWDGDCAVLTSIGLDHADWLGTDRGVIATEKAAIGRRGRPFVLGEPDPPASLAPFVREAGFRLIDVGARARETLPVTALPGEHQRRNAACALAVIECLDTHLPVEADVARVALGTVTLAARFEQREVDGVTLVLDVAHNPAAAAVLAATWRERFGTARALCVFAAFADKDIEGIVDELSPLVAHWFCAALEAPRAAPADVFEARVRAALGGVTRRDGDARGGTDVGRVRLDMFGRVDDALARALARASTARAPVLVCGSFLTVAAAHSALDG